MIIRGRGSCRIRIVHIIMNLIWIWSDLSWYNVSNSGSVAVVKIYRISVYCMTTSKYVVIFKELNVFAFDVFATRYENIVSHFFVYPTMGDIWIMNFHDRNIMCMAQRLANHQTSNSDDLLVFSKRGWHHFATLIFLSRVQYVIVRVIKKKDTV